MTDAMRVRRRRAHNFAAVPHKLARDSSLSDKALRVWLVLQCYADWDDDTCYPSMDTLSDDMGCSRSTVKRAVADLVERGLLLVESGQQAGKPNVYTVCDEPVEKLSEQVEGSVISGPGGGSLVDHPGGPPMDQGGGSPTTHKQEPCQQEPDEREPGTISAPSLTLLTEHLPELSDRPNPFDLFYSIYPRKAGRLKAETAMVKALKRAPAEEIIAGAMRFRDDPNREPEFTPHPATWLNQGRWDDDPLPPRRGTRKEQADSAAWGTIGRLINEGSRS